MFLQHMDERIETLTARLNQVRDYLVSDIKSDTVDSYANLYEKLIDLQARISELKQQREYFVMWQSYEKKRLTSEK